MWCQACREDVPAIASFEEGVFCCARCGGPMSRGAADHALNLEGHGIDLAQDHSVPPLEMDWHQNDALWEVERVLRTTSRPATQPTTRRFDPPQLQSRRPAYLGYPQPSLTASLPKPGRGVFWWLGGVCVGLSLAVFFCGLTLVGCAMLTGRGELWNWGLPVSLAGSLGMGLGFLFQRIGHWARRRRIALASTSQEHCAVCSTPRHTAHPIPAPYFVSQPLSAPSPYAMLADMQGQLDWLTTRVASQRQQSY